MEVTKQHDTSYFHLAGIVPVAGQKLDFNQILPDCLMPIAQDYTLIEAAVVECAWAGCDTIWVVCNDDTSPLIREKLGDFVEDPVFSHRRHDPYPKDSKRFIPIYYVPIHPKDRDKRDCLSWSVVYGSLLAFKVSSNISSWVVPNKYYVSFPYGYFPAWQLREHRKLISSEKNFYVSYLGKTMKDNNYLSFTFGKDEFLEFRRVVRTGTGKHVPGKGYVPVEERELLPIEERWSARFFEIEQVFEPFNLDTANELKIDNFYNISSWREYTDFFRTIDFSIKKPNYILIKEGANAVGEDYLEDDEE